MKKLFVSQPMKNKSNDEINAPADARPLWFLGKSLELLSTADIAYFADGWTYSRGCRVEHLCAIEYGIDIVHN